MAERIDLFEPDYEGPVLSDTIVVFRDGSVDTFSQAFAQDWDFADEVERFDLAVEDTGDYSADLSRMLQAAHDAVFDATVDEAAALIDSSAQYIRRLLRDGEILGYRVGTGAAAPWRVSSASVEAYRERVNPRGGRPAKPEQWLLDLTGSWRLFWGDHPIPPNMTPAGTVTSTASGETFALLVNRELGWMARGLDGEHVGLERVSLVDAGRLED